MTDRKKFIDRLREFAAGQRCLFDWKDLLWACLNPTVNYEDFFAADHEPVVLGPELKNDVVTLYRVAAKTQELGVFAQQAICNASVAFLATVMSEPELAELKANNPIDDGYDRDFINIQEALDRVSESDLMGVNAPGLVAHSKTWGTAYATEVIATALGNIRIDRNSIQQLWLAVRLHQKANSDSSPASRLIIACLCKVINEKRLAISDPASIGILDLL